MASVNTSPGVSILKNKEAAFFLAQYLSARGILRDDALPTNGNRELYYESESQFWMDIIKNENIYEASRVFLQEFSIMEWIPQSPGLYHTE